jgi:hypothetical protein
MRLCCESAGAVNLTCGRVADCRRQCQRVVASTACALAQSSASARHTRKPFLSGCHRAACRLTVHHGADALR